MSEHGEHGRGRREDGAATAACARVRARLARLLDGGLAPLETARDEGHLEACVGCAAERARWERLLSAVRAAAAPAPEELAFATRGLDERLAGAAARLRRRALARRAAPLGGAVAAAAAATALLAGAWRLSGADEQALAALPPLAQLPARLRLSLLEDAAWLLGAPSAPAFLPAGPPRPAGAAGEAGS